MLSEIKLKSALSAHKGVPPEIKSPHRYQVMPTCELDFAGTELPSITLLKTPSNCLRRARTVVLYFSFSPSSPPKAALAQSPRHSP